MTEISLPYDQVCEIIDRTASGRVCEPGKEPETFTQSWWKSQYAQFGHALWRALEEAHLARQTERT